MFTPSVDLKNELKQTSVAITCYDRNGEVVKRVTSTDDAEVEDNDNEGENTNQGGTNTGTNTGDNTNQGGGSDNNGGVEEG